MSGSSRSGKVNFATFFALWAEVKRWDVPDVHWRAVHWFEHCGEHAVMRCFRGFGKSTLLAAYNAWRYYSDPTYRILHQGADDQMAYKTSRDTQGVLRQHPLTAGMLPARPGPVEQWWVEGAADERNASMFAKGITSTTTSSRADECQNDDVEVPKNIQNPEAREKMRARLNEQIHIMVPGARHLFIGTPHTFDSLYDEQQRLGADCLTIRMFELEHRIEAATAATYTLPFAPDMVFSGIGEQARLLKPDADYTLSGREITFKRPPGGLVDCYAGSSWPERFTPQEMAKRRRKTRTINEWDSQYQLHAKPLTDVRLDPDRICLYNCEPRFDTANKVLRMWLGQARIVGGVIRWDPSAAKPKSDVSAVALMLQDDAGRRYWHRAEALKGDVAEFAEDGKTINGGQVWGICELVERYGIRRVSVETNGAGTFAPAILKAALKQRGLQCGVGDVHESRNKNKAILEAFEPLLSAQGMLWAHVSVADGLNPAPGQDGPAFAELRQWNPAVTDQPDDYIDAAAKAITDQPERVGAQVRNRTAPDRDDWRPVAGIFEAELTF